MMKKYLKFLCGIIFIATIAICVGCEKKIEQEQDIGNAGLFHAVNMTTNETISISGGINVEEEILPTLDAQNGHIIKLSFVKSEKYKNYTFGTVFTLPDGTKITNKSEYEYTIKNLSPGEYIISLSAKYEEKDAVLLTAGGRFALVIRE